MQLFLGAGQLSRLPRKYACPPSVMLWFHFRVTTKAGVFGRQAGTLEGYSYSDALVQSTIVWDETTINRLFKEGPDVVTPGTKMPIQRMKSDRDLRDLVAFLQSATKTP